MPSIDLLNTFLVVVPGAMTVWSFRYFSNSNKTGDFEYLMLSVFWGAFILACLGSAMPLPSSICDRRCADFMAGRGMAELAKTNPERAEGISRHHDGMVRNGWTVEAWFGEESERARAKWGYKPLSKKKEKTRREALRRMIDAGVFGQPA